MLALGSNTSTFPLGRSDGLPTKLIRHPALEDRLTQSELLFDPLPCVTSSQIVTARANPSAMPRAAGCTPCAVKVVMIIRAGTNIKIRTATRQTIFMPSILAGRPSGRQGKRLRCVACLSLRRKEGRRLLESALKSSSHTAKTGHTGIL